MKRRLLLLLLGAAALGLAWVAFDLLSPYRGYAGSVILDFAPGSRVSQIADSLVAHGVLRHRLPFLLRYLVGRPRHTLRAGQYMFDRPLRPVDVYRRLVLGEVYLHTVVIPEGSDRFDMARILNQRLGIDPALFLRMTRQNMPIHDLDPTAPSLEGYLFPDTYRFPRGVSAATVVTTMLARFRHILATRFAGQVPSPTPALSQVGRGVGTLTPGSPSQARKGASASSADSPPQSGRGPGGGVIRGWHDVITLASLVEKETPEASERPLVAGVFERRLELGMPLQCDPTVVYAAQLEDRPAGSITQSDLQLDSPYNTYRHAGLPPGPIANPGEASIRAALHPAAGDALYFVANNQGGHVFARTLSEHQLNVARYRREVAASQRKEAETAGKNSKPAPGAKRSAAGAKNRAGNQKADHP
jgi:UPF0755 protein